MKHAILIMAHDEFLHLEHLIEYFCKDCSIFIHFDKDGSISDNEIKKAAGWNNVLRTYKKYSIHWGGFNMLRCELFLLDEATKHCEADYFHLLSGQDYPIKPLKIFLDFFEKNQGQDFIANVHLPHPRWQNNTYSRFSYYYPFDSMKHGEKSSRFMKTIHCLQDKLSLKRRIPDYFPHLYGGSQWFSITRESVELLLKYNAKHKRFYNRLRWTFAPEECYIQTVLKNIAPEGRITNNNKRFIRWHMENNNRPSNLGVEHFHLLVESRQLIARKFKSPFSLRLIPLIDEYLLHDNPVISDQETGGWEYDGYLQYKYDNTFLISFNKYCEWMDYHHVLDVGCGAGNVVAALRRCGLATTGFDINPFTPELSKRLLTENDTPCIVADLTDDLSSDHLFDVVLCLDVLQYIPKRKLEKAIGNIIKLSKGAIIISYTYEIGNSYTQILLELEKQMKSTFTYNKGMSNFIQSFSSVYKNVMLFEHHN